MCAIFGFTSPSLKKEQILPYFEKTKSRGPDDTRLEPAGSGMLGFHRLAIMGLHPEGMQPFHRGGDMAVCNGELYGFRPVKKALEAKGYVFASDSDCEIILPLWQWSDRYSGQICRPYNNVPAGTGRRAHRGRRDFSLRWRR